MIFNMTSDTKQYFLCQVPLFCLEYGTSQKTHQFAYEDPLRSIMFPDSVPSSIPFCIFFQTLFFCLNTTCNSRILLHKLNVYLNLFFLCDNNIQSNTYAQNLKKLVPRKKSLRSESTVLILPGNHYPDQQAFCEIPAKIYMHALPV